MRSSFQVLLLRRTQDTALQEFEDHVLAAFQGGKDIGGYLASGEDLGIQIEIFRSMPNADASEVLHRFEHTLVVALVDLASVRDGDYLDWIVECYKHATAGKRHQVLISVADERTKEAILAKHYEDLQHLQIVTLSDLGERAIRAAMLALMTLHTARQLLVRDLLGVPDKDSIPALKLFISHAKMDGLPLAGALKNQIDLIAWLRRFYDAEDLPPGCDWQRELESGVASSIVIMLRTDAYDGRYWCQREVLWADEYAVPAVLVDARTSLQFPSAVLPFGRIPAVRIPDGNLLRIIFLALREALRASYFASSVRAMEIAGLLPSNSVRRVFSYAPSMAAILRACEALTTSHEPKSHTRMIIYPDPPLRAGNYEAARALVLSVLPGAMLITPQTLAASEAQLPA